MTRTRFFILWATVLLGFAALGDAQRPSIFTTVQTTSTGASSLLVGCAAGVTSGCTGGIKSGDVVLTNAQGQVSTFTISPSAGVLLETKSSSGKKAYVGMVETGAGAWYQGVDGGDTSLYTRPTSVTTTYGQKLTTGGSVTYAGNITLSGVQDVTLSAGGNTPNLSVDTHMLRVTTSGAANLYGLTSSVTPQGRTLVICFISSGGTFQVMHDNAGASADDRFYVSGGLDKAVPLYGCFTATYDATSSRWRTSAI